MAQANSVCPLPFLFYSTLPIQLETSELKHEAYVHQLNLCKMSVVKKVINQVLFYNANVLVNRLC